MRVLYITGRELGYSRNDVLLRAFLRFAQVDVLASRQRPASLLRQSLRLAWQALPRLRSSGYDLTFIGFYGHLLMLPTGLLTNRPVLFDAFVSTYDTLVDDRKSISAKSPAGRAALWLDRTACRWATHVLLDTQQHCDYFARTLNLPIDRFTAVPVGCNEDLFFPRPVQPDGAGPLRVLYYTSYMPLHGVDVVVRAAHLLKAEPVRFRLIGEGPTHAQVQRMALQMGLENIEFAPPVPLEQLPDELAEADICLGGHFGASEKAGRVVPGKVYQVLAMQRPLIATTTPANLALLHNREAAYLCPPGDPGALAESILHLCRNRSLRQDLARGGRRLYLDRCSEAVITDRLRGVVGDMLA